MLANKKLLLPPWLAYPEIERGSIGWRMGYGEDYLMKWGSWYNALQPEEATEYQQLFPEPITWKGYWKHQNERLYYKYDNLNFFIELWRDGGIPKYFLEQVRADYASGKKQTIQTFWGHQPL